MSDVPGKEVLFLSTNLLDAYYSSNILVHFANHDLTNSIALSVVNAFTVISKIKNPRVKQDVEYNYTDDISPISSLTNFDINNCLSQNLS